MNQNEAETLAAAIKAWPFPFVHAYVSRLGGADRSAVMVTVSLDPKSTWTNGILENSRYVKLAFHSRGAEGVEFEQISGRGAKLRAFTVANKPALYKKLAKLQNDLRAQA